MNDETTSTHERLLQEAAALFARRGYSGTSMSDIAREVGVRKASLYNYYPSKEDLLLDLLERSLRSWTESCYHGFKRTDADSLEVKLSAYLDSVVGFARTHPQAMALIRLATAQVPGELRAKVHKQFETYETEWHNDLVEMFRKAVDSGEITSADPEILTLAWGIFIDGIAVRFVLANDRTNAIIDNLQPLWRLFWRGLGGIDPQTEISV
jgi:AcrR family transcriptional regulator